MTHSHCQTWNASLPPGGTARSDVAITVDYELWNFLGSHRVSVEREMLDPTEQLMTVCERFDARLTLMFEFAGYLLLQASAPQLARAIEAQLKDAVRRGHDVQLHLHPHLLPELGGRYDAARRRLSISRYRTIHEALAVCPNLLTEARRHCQSLLRAVDPGYEMTVFRAGKYQVQPHADVYRALAGAGFTAASNVVAGQRLRSGADFAGYDYRHAWTETQPYYPDDTDICWPADVREESILELPICVSGGTAWSFDTLDGPALQKVYEQHRARRRSLVMLGHSKGPVGPKTRALAYCLSRIAAGDGANFVTLSETARRWREVCRHQSVTAWQQCLQSHRDALATASVVADSSDHAIVQLASRQIYQIAGQRAECRIGVVNGGLGYSVLAPILQRCDELSSISVEAWDADPLAGKIACQAILDARRSIVRCPTQSDERFDMIIMAGLSGPAPQRVRELEATVTSLAAEGVLLVFAAHQGLVQRLLRALDDTRIRLSVRYPWLSVALRGAIRLRRRRRAATASPHVGDPVLAARRQQMLESHVWTRDEYRRAIQQSGCEVVALHPLTARGRYGWQRRLFGDRCLLVARRREADATQTEVPLRKAA